MTVARSGGGSVQRSPQGGLAEVLDLVLDKGLVIDAFIKVSVVGIEILTIDARVVVASVDTYLRFAESTNRLDLHAKGGKGLPDLLNSGGRAAAERATYRAAKSKTSGVLEAGKESGTRSAARRVHLVVGEAELAVDRVVVYALIYMRGTHEDHDGWAADHGATGWSYDEVLPSFIRFENNADVHDDFHGTDGGLHVTTRRWVSPTRRRSSIPRWTRGSTATRTSTVLSRPARACSR